MISLLIIWFPHTSGLNQAEQDIFKPDNSAKQQLELLHQSKVEINTSTQHVHEYSICLPLESLELLQQHI